MRIGEVVAASGVTAQTIRFYERQGLLPVPPRQGNGYREYDGTAVSRLRFVRAAQNAGLTLSEIGGIISVRDCGEVPCAHVSELLSVKLAEVRARQQELAVWGQELQGFSASSGRHEAASSSPIRRACAVSPPTTYN